MLTPQPLVTAWLDVIDDVALQVLGTRDRTGTALVDEVRALSTVYTRDRDALATQGDPIAGRLRFFLPRDLPKIEGPLCDLARAGMLPPGPRWRVLDLGAGLGTTSLGIAGIAHRQGIEHVHVTAYESHRTSLDVFRALAERCGRGILAEHTTPVTVDAHCGDLLRASGDGYDLVVLGLSLNELFRDTATVQRRADLLRSLLERCSEHGSVVVVEPALRTTSRALQQVRDVLVADGVSVASPCTHTARCPLLVRERDWCHQELAVPLPTPLVPVAKAAGLRFERLTWAHLVLHRGSQATSDAWRVVGGPVFSKGRTEWHVCGAPGLARVARLDRHKTASDPLNTVRRGSLLNIEPNPADGALVRTDRVDVTVLSDAQG